MEIIIVDDRSTDDTRQRIANWAAKDARVRLIDGAELPHGWLGKPWACMQGSLAATGEILVFTDSDTTHSPTLLAHAVGALQRDKIDLLTVTTYLECVTFWERVVMPQVFALLGLRYTPNRINTATAPWHVVANGQFIMLPRTSYEALGGHASVRGQVVEDLALAQHCVREGRRLRMFCAETLISTRMYRSLGELVEGWGKNLHLGAKESLPPGPMRKLAPLGLILGLGFWLVPFAALLAGIAPMATLSAIGASLLFWTLMCFGMSIPVWYGALYPLGAVMALFIAGRSIAKGRKNVVWRGRSYAIGE
jgi:chlorobactene glucosyltransferase